MGDISKAHGNVSITMGASLERFSDQDLSVIQIVIRCLAKGYQECRLEVKTGETFTVIKKVGDKGCTYKIFDPQ